MEMWIALFRHLETTPSGPFGQVLEITSILMLEQQGQNIGGGLFSFGFGSALSL